MAITLKTNTVAGAGFIANGYSADWSGCETLVSGVTGKSIYIERIYINVHDVATQIYRTITFGAGETGGSVTTIVLGPLICSSDEIHKLVFTRPLFITAATDFVADVDASGVVTIIAQGYIQ